MYLNTLKQIRQEMYDCLLKAKDALFNTVDALSTETTAKSLPEVTQSCCLPGLVRKRPARRNAP